MLVRSGGALMRGIVVFFLVHCVALQVSAEETEEVLVNGDQRSLPEPLDAGARVLHEEGVEFYAAGGAAKLPVLRGMNDDRIKLLVDGAETTSACANHMNPALSYIDTSRIKTTEVIAGITPVSLGGDSIAGTILIESEAPRYSSSSDTLLTSGYLAAFYKSNNRNNSETINAALASDSLSLEYTGTLDQAESYFDGHGDKVLDSLYRTESHNFTLGMRGEAQELRIKLSHQEVPYQGFPNQYMDMVGNVSNSINLHYVRDVHGGQLESRLTWQGVTHEMGFFSDEKPGTMPMNTKGTDVGAQIKFSLPLTDKHQLRMGYEYHGFQLDDWWPAVAGSMMMGPDDFINIHDGKKTRNALWLESELHANAQWMTLLGLRYEHVETNTGDVQPYNTMSSMMMPNLDAEAALEFNARDHRQRDDNLDITLLARYEPGPERSIEFGYARKTRTPNLYERYSWGRNSMSMTMVGWFGDGNGYVGDIDVKPEIAHTLGMTLAWRSARQNAWQLTVEPYYSYVDNYVDVMEVGSFNPAMAMAVTRPKLQFVNRDAAFYGLDIKGQLSVWESDMWGRGRINSRLSYMRATRRDTGPQDLYHVMPLNFSASLEQTLNRWSNRLELQWVAAKTHVDLLRRENTSAGYGLVNLATRYQLGAVTLSAGVRNLLNKYYVLPLGGVSLAQWSAEGKTGPFESLPGEGRSYDLGVRYSF